MHNAHPSLHGAHAHEGSDGGQARGDATEVQKELQSEVRRLQQELLNLQHVAQVWPGTLWETAYLRCEEQGQI